MRLRGLRPPKLLDVVDNVLPLLKKVPLCLSLREEGAEKFHQAALVPHLCKCGVFYPAKGEQCVSTVKEIKLTKISVMPELLSGLDTSI